MTTSFTEEDIRILGECAKESFYRRSLPIGSMFAIATLSAYRAGYMKKTTRFGLLTKLGLNVLIGYILGKISYHHICKEKLMQSSNSNIGKFLRDNYESNSNNTKNILKVTLLNDQKTNEDINISPSSEESVTIDNRLNTSEMNVANISPNSEVPVDVIEYPFDNLETITAFDIRPFSSTIHSDSYEEVK